MKSKFFISIFVIVVVAIATVALVQKKSSGPQRMYKVGILARGASATYMSSIEGFKKKMAALGYTEGETVTYDIRIVDAKEDLPKAVDAFIAASVDLIHTYSTPATQAAYKATRNLPAPIPIVFGSLGDPLNAGVVKNIQRPDTNVTGVASLSTELTAKRLELLRDVDPAVKRVAVPRSTAELNDAASLRSIEIATETAARLGIELVLYPVRSADEHAAVAKEITRTEVDGIIIPADSLIFAGISHYVAQSLKEKLPLAGFDITQVEGGALVGFGPDYETMGEQSALLAHQILRGRSPAVIAVEVPKKLLLMLNQKTARAIGIAFPDALVRSADVVIDE